MSQQPNLFVNSFQKGAAENANIGTGTLVGIETYSRKGTARLTKDTTASTGSFGNMPKYIATSGNVGFIYSAFSSGGRARLFVSTNNGVSWSDTGTSIGSTSARGLIYFPCISSPTGGYYLYFTDTSIYYFQDGGTVLLGPVNGVSLISGEHPTILSPIDGYVYFGNNNFVGKIGYGMSATFNPGGTPGTDFYANSKQLTLSLIYQVTCLSFLMPNYIAIGTCGGNLGGPGYNPQIADIIFWNALNILPDSTLRLYNRSNQVGIINAGSGVSDGLIQSGIAQMVNRNNTIYAVTGGNFCVYECTGANFSLVTDLSLHSSIRKPAGTESNLLPFIAGFSPAMAVIGNKILVGISTPNSPSYPSGYGLFPCGIWTIAFSDSGGIGEISYGINGNSVQCEFTISTGTIVATNNLYQIGCIFPLSGNSALISWADGASVGMDYIDTNQYQPNISNVIIESEMMEIGTPLSPVTVGNLQFNLVSNLMVGQTISLYYRTAFDQDFQLVTAYLFNGTFTGDGTTNAYSVSNHAIGQTRYIQFQIHMATVPSSTDATIATYTPQLRNFIVDNDKTQ